MFRHLVCLAILRYIDLHSFHPPEKLRNFAPKMLIICKNSIIFSFCFWPLQ